MYDGNKKRSVFFKNVALFLIQKQEFCFQEKKYSNTSLLL
jgi:hypothetical protein